MVKLKKFKYLQNMKKPYLAAALVIIVVLGVFTFNVFSKSSSNSEINSNPAGSEDELTIQVDEKQQEVTDQPTNESPSPSATTSPTTQNKPKTTATTPQPVADTTAPTAPTNLTAQDSPINFNEGYIHLSWNSSTDNVGVTGYRIYRDGELLAEVSGGTTQYTYVERCMWNHKFTVKAFDATGNLSGPSNEKSFGVSEGCPI